MSSKRSGLAKSVLNGDSMVKRKYGVGIDVESNKMLKERGGATTTTTAATTAACNKVFSLPALLVQLLPSSQNLTSSISRTLKAICTSVWCKSIDLTKKPEANVNGLEGDKRKVPLHDEAHTGLAIGYKVKLFKMEYVSRLYVWTEVASSYLPRDHQDLGVIPKLLGLITRLKIMLDNINVEPCLRTPPRHMPDELLPDNARPQPVNVTPSTRPFFKDHRRPSVSTEPAQDK
ncbi:MAG: hypothetical protein JOS17DRAFT_797052 [Linnemannia elongata]|nr:MAG: hypothetical protein JOS17DRAFT_797052 [Linnemannia elongata]